MWFKNLQIYRLPQNWPITADALEKLLAGRSLQPCGATDCRQAGWINPCSHAGLVHSLNRQWLLALGIEQKLLPSTVIRQEARNRAQDIHEKEGRRIGRKEMRDLCERVTQELLPRAFIQKRTLFGWIDPVNGWLVIDAASAAKAEEFLEHLYQSVDGLPARPLKTNQSPSAVMTSWLEQGEAPAPFTLDMDLELRSAEDARIRYVRHSLEGEEIRRHILEGKAVTRLAMTWADRISFVLDDKLQIKRLAFLDILKEESDTQAENEETRFDLDFTLMTGEISRLLDDLLEALGGEAATEANA